MMTETLAKSYVPNEHESAMSEKWDLARAFHAEPDGPGTPYCVLIPPPNVTAALHLGHAFNNTLQDILVRYHRMRGDNTLWMPGTDHAGIATQSVVEKRLANEGKRRIDFSREDFVALVQEWKDEYEATITNQLKAMGCSCDYERQRFTMDDMCATAVREAFFRLFQAGLIYRGKRLVNWDPVSQTALADDEVEMEEVQGHMYYLRYPLVHPSENPDDPFDCQEVTWSELAVRGYPGARNHDDDEEIAWLTVATTRPETYLGDTAVAVNPADPRAKALRGLCVQLPLVGRVIPIVEDDYVVMPDEESNEAKAQYATGFLKVTPAHDPNDYDIGQRHHDAIMRNSAREVVINVMAPDASISDQHGWSDVGDAHLFVGLSRAEAREKVLREFDARGLYERKRAYTHSVGHSYRSHAAIEPYMSDQWYVKVTDDQLVGRAQRALEENDLTFFPDRYAKTYSAWHENLRDWCISRQLWWGHRIPVWTKRPAEGDVLDPKIIEWWDRIIKENPDRVAGQLAPDHINLAMGTNADDLIDQAEADGFVQDPDVLDTWFSSGLWPLSTMGWPDPSAYPETEGLLDTFNPTSVLCTAREIITLWVSRMVMFNRYFLDDQRVPYRDVYIHPMIQDGHGQKMSKSLGNGVDPRDIIHTHGADALRFVLAQIATATQDVRLTVDTLCPHCETTFHPKEITTSARHRVAAPTQTCPKCGKSMVTVYGELSGEGRATDDMPLARNTSSRFDLGRNFCNKLWNAVRFALSNLDNAATGQPEETDQTLADRWILARLHRTLHRVEDSIAAYQFNVYAEAMYDFIWRDFCDWYLEAIKPTVKENAAQQQVLRTVLNATLRLLHPIMPFVTEALWPHVTGAGKAGVPGIHLGDSDVLATADWPSIACTIDDSEAHDTFERLQRLVEQIRAIRSENGVKDREKVALQLSADAMALAHRGSASMTALAGLTSVEPFNPGQLPPSGVVFHFEGADQAVILPKKEIDLHAERQRLIDELARLDTQIAGLRGRLSNAGYVEKAPSHLVEETRNSLAQAESERASKQDALDQLGD